MRTTILDNQRLSLSHLAVARLGLEPRYHAPEACVLPLDDLALYVIEPPRCASPKL